MQRPWKNRQAKDHPTQPPSDGRKPRFRLPGLVTRAAYSGIAALCGNVGIGLVFDRQRLGHRQPRPPRERDRVQEPVFRQRSVPGLGLDRSWRNARTIAAHNPRIYRDRIVGAVAVTGAPPPRQYRVGSA